MSCRTEEEEVSSVFLDTLLPFKRDENHLITECKKKVVDLIISNWCRDRLSVQKEKMKIGDYSYLYTF